MIISASSALRIVNFAVDEQSGTPFDVIVVRSSRTQSSLHNSKASEKFFASKANVALPSTSIANTDPEKTVIDLTIGHRSAVGQVRSHECFAGAMILDIQASPEPC